MINMAKQEPLTLIQFQKKFATEEACHSHLFTMKWPEGFRWLHTVISNAKATYQGLDSKHLQAYLNEFCYRFNRRKFKGELFNRLLSCCSFTHVITYSELTA
jgi:transposase-like protein